MKTPRTDFIASQCNADSEQSDLSAYHIMMAHAYELERENAELRKDAERYRWLMKNWNGEVQRLHGIQEQLAAEDWAKKHPHGGPGYGKDYTDRFLESAIDRALEAQRKGVKEAA